MKSVFRQKLLQLDAQHRLRSLKGAHGIDFTSNDYLGFAAHPVLRAAALQAIESGMAAGATGSRLLRGQNPAHEALEIFAADYFHCEKSLFFANGFLANYAIFTTLPDRHDVVLYDSLVHASMRDGIRAGAAQAIKIPHNDLQAFEDALKVHAGKSGQIWVAIESLYSMDGDLAPLAELHALCGRYSAMLVVDEAHATGVFGATGKGLSEGLAHDCMITLHTGGKALGVAGGLICARGDIIDYLINRARPFIYSTAPPPLQAHLVQTALELVQAEPWRRQRLLALRDLVNGLLGTDSPGQIIPVVLGEDKRALAAASHMQQAGFDIRAIRPPSVPEGASRLRISLNADLEDRDVENFCYHLNSFL